MEPNSGFDIGQMAIIRETAQETAKALIREIDYPGVIERAIANHQVACPVGQNLRDYMSRLRGAAWVFGLIFGIVGIGGIIQFVSWAVAALR